MGTKTRHKKLQDTADRRRNNNIWIIEDPEAEVEWERKHFLKYLRID